MLFNSFEFLVFLPIVFVLYWRLARRGQNRLLILASYVFYGWWDWRFLSLIVLSSIVDYVAGLRIGASERPGARRAWLGASLLVNLGALGVFKYFDFFAASFAELLAAFGLEATPVELKLLLPVGISFYTFQTLSYTIDVYRKKIPVHRSVTDFFAFVSFFPQLVAGPIERAGNLLGQFAERRKFDPATARDGCRQMLWGFVKKVVVADNLSAFVESAYAAPDEAGGAMLLVATFFFAIQIYCDFSGYSDIAIGCARLFGFRLMRNFAYPYFATSISDFWTRWHISLSSWFRDYVYIPLGGGRTSLPRRTLNVFLTFLISGFWHGANWTFLVWGALHGLYYLPEMILGAIRGKAPTRVRFVAPRILVTFVLVCIGWVFFRAASVGDAWSILTRIATDTDAAAAIRLALKLKLLVVAMLAVEWIMRKHPHALHVEGLSRTARWTIYYILVIVILTLGNFSYVPFIYFQF